MHLIEHLLIVVLGCGVVVVPQLLAPLGPGRIIGGVAFRNGGDVGGYVHAVNAIRWGRLRVCLRLADGSLVEVVLRRREARDFRNRAGFDSAVLVDVVVRPALGGAGLVATGWSLVDRRALASRPKPIVLGLVGIAGSVETDRGGNRILTLRYQSTLGCWREGRALLTLVAGDRPSDIEPGDVVLLSGRLVQPRGGGLRQVLEANGCRRLRASS